MNMLSMAVLAGTHDALYTNATPFSQRRVVEHKTYTPADLDRITKAEAKRQRKAAKRAEIASREQEKGV
jgi:hypothetical protein